MLSAYFMRCFGADPEHLYTFIRFLEQHCAELRRTPKEQRQVARRYLQILSPLSERFGFFEEKERMDTLCFRITEPKQFREMSATLSRYRQRSRGVIRRISAILERLLKSTGQAYVLQGRYKNLYSVRRKLELKGRMHSPLQLHDIFAFRIILDTQNDADCFGIVNMLHDTFQPIPGKFKDYITIPKINGYQSLHTILNGVISDLDLPIEVQIRTRAMHEFAEQGIASHWLYAHQKRTQWITRREEQLMSHFASLSKEASREDVVHCITPRGDILRMPAGCTILDVAYRIHTDIGNRASGALVDDRPRSVHHLVQEGDRVQILTTKTHAHSRS